MRTFSSKFHQAAITVLHSAAVMVSDAALRLLLGSGAQDLVQAVLHGFDARLHTMRVATVSVQPSGAATVQYTAEIERVDGGHACETLVATTGSRLVAGSAVLKGDLGGEQVQVGLWRWPNDPALPALRRATDPVQLADLLQAAGLTRTATPTIRVRSYRPGRRAVLEVAGGGAPLFCKIVRPSRIDALRHRHHLLTPHVPVPPLLMTTDDGLVVMPALTGTPARTLLNSAGNAPRDQPGPLPTGPTLDTLLDRFPDAVTELSARADHLDRVEHFAGILIRTAITDQSSRARLDALVARLAAAERGEHPVVPVHGDFYEGQLLVEHGTVTGLLDVDTAGPGHRIDEWATLLAHLSILPGTPARHWGAHLLAHAERQFSRTHLRPRIAAALLGLATGPFRTQQDNWAARTAYRLELAERWLEPKMKAPSSRSPTGLTTPTKT